MTVRRVLHLVNRWERGGVERHVRDLVKGMDASGITGHIAAWLPAGDDAPEGFTRLGLYDCDGTRRSIAGMLQAIGVVHDLVDGAHIDVLHVHSRLLLPVAAAVARRTGVARVLTLHSNYDRLTWLPWQPPHVIALSNVSRDMYLARRTDDADRTVHVVHNGIMLPPDARGDDGGQTDPDAPRIAFIGRFTDTKGGDVLLDAVAHLHAKGRSMHLILAGDGPLRADWQSRAERLGVSTACTWPGMVNDIPTLLRTVDLVAMPSTGLEGSPYVALDALGAGCILLCSDLPVLRELYEGCPSVLLHRAGDAADLARSIDVACRLDAAELRKRRAAARTFIAAYASLEEMLHATMNVYEHASD